MTVEEFKPVLQVREDVKKRLRMTGKKGSDLARELGLNYDVLNGYLNGRRAMPQGMDDRINGALSVWESGF